MSSTDLEHVETHSGRADALTLDIELAKPREENIFATDYYEILRIGPLADEETIERIYRTLADRFHPDNPSTGDPGTFLRLTEAYETLSNPIRRAKYNLLRQRTRAERFWLRGREFFDGVRGAQNRRLALLCLLYRRRISAHEAPGFSILDLEGLTGCTREELVYALWYLCEKKWAAIGDLTAYSITVDGFDVVESKLEEQLEFRALATVCYYAHAEREEPARVEPGSWKNDPLPLDIEPARAIEGDTSVADYYEILGIGPQADEETIERVYHTLAGRFHPDNPGSGDAKTFLRIKDAYDTLSDPVRRAQYNALRQTTKYSTRFRLRGREFFDGIRGEQLRRLAVLCLLYRQAASEPSGLTVLDLEQLTGCTREELGSVLWYLREKKWTKSGEFTEYSITAAGFDIVENKLENREAARSQAWLNSEDTRGNELVYTQASALQPAGESQQNGSVPSQSLLPSATIAPAIPESQQMAESEPTDIETIQAIEAIEVETQSEDLEVAQGPFPPEETSGVAEQVTRIEDGAEPAAQSQPEVPVTHQSSLSTAAIAPANLNPRDMAESGRTGIKARGAPGKTWRLRKDRFRLKKRVASQSRFLGSRRSWVWFNPHDTQGDESADPRDSAAQADELSQQSIPVTPDSDRTYIEVFEVGEPSKNVEVAPVPIPLEEASYIAEQVTRFENGAESEEREAARSWDWLIPDDTPDDESVYPRAGATQAAEQCQPDVPATPQSPISKPMAESERADIAAIEAEPPSENVELASVSIPSEEASGVAEQVAPQSPLSNAPIAPENQYSHSMAEDERADIAAIEAEPPSENGELDPVSIPPEEASGIAEPITPFEPDAEPAAQSQPDVNVTPQSPGVSCMNNSKKAIALGEGGVAVSAEKRVILSMGGKGGVGKTSVMTGLAEWFEENRIPVTLLDLDTENKSRGSFTHFFGGSVPKINIHTPAGLDAFVDHLADVAPVILGDMGAGAGKITHDWFEKMYPDVAELGIVFTAIGVVTSDPASVESVLDWAAALEDRVAYVIVENNLTEHTDFTYWQESSQAEEFRKRFQPAIVRLDYRLADLENAVRNYGVTLGQVAGRTTPHAELQKASLVMRAQSYRRRMFAEFEKVKELLLP